MDFGKIFTRAWEIIWKYKILWIFGILSGCGTQSGGNNSGSNRTGYQVEPGDQTYDALPPAWQQFFMQAERYFERNAEAIVSIALIAVLIGVILVFVFALLRSFGIIGLVKGTLKAEAGEEASITWSHLADEAQPYLWRVFGLYFLFAITVFVISAVLLLFGIITVVGLCLVIPVLCLLVPAYWLASVVVTQSVIAIVAEDLSIPDAIKRGWNIFRDNLGGMVIVGLILLVGGAIIGFIIGLPQILSAIPMLTAFLNGELLESPESFFKSLGYTLIIAIAYWPILLTLRGILNSYINSAWTLTYLETQKPKLEIEEPPALEPAA